MHHQRIGRCPLQAVLRQTKQVMIFARRRNELPLHPLSLEAEHHNHVATVERGIEIAKRLRAHCFNLGGHQRWRGA